MRRDPQEAIAFHYDVSNEFYALFLDARMVYTCAYYRDPYRSLADAQADKLDLVCRKLHLAAGERLLDLGCGWGALVLWAAEQHGAEAFGVTLSRAQATWADAAIRRAGLGHRARVRHGDWSGVDADARFDKIAAVGLIEHVGVRRYDEFFGAVHRRLEPGGLFLNHGITRRKGAGRTSEMDFLKRHVFPGAEITDVSATLDAVERSGFEILDVEHLGLHYARTTRQWVERLQANAERARSLVGERVYRTWIAYLAAASVAFEEGWIGLHQIVAAKRAEGVGRSTEPRTREAVYAPRSVARAS